MVRSLILLLTLFLAMLPFAASATVIPDTTSPGRNRPSGPAPSCRPAPAGDAEPIPSERFFKLFYLGVTQVSGPGFEGLKPDTFIPEPVILLVPQGYASLDDTFRRRDGAGMLFSAVYPTFNPFGCTDADDDRVEVVFGLAPEPWLREIPRSLREELEARKASESGTTFTAMPVAPGFEEDFIVEFPSAYTSSGRQRTEFLSYRDGNGILHDAYCNPNAEVPGCQFETAVPGTYISVSYRMVKKLLPHRQEIEAGVLGLIGKWIADGK